MKKILIFIIGLILFSSNINAQNGTFYIKDKIESVELIKCSILQTLDNEEPIHQGLAWQKSLKGRYDPSYHETVIYIWTEDILWDEKELNLYCYFVGTYTYKNKDDMYRTVPFYISKDLYNNFPEVRLTLSILKLRKNGD